MKIYRKEAGTWELWHEGLVSFAGSRFDRDRRVCEITVETDDLYDCIEKNLKKKFNLLSIGTPRSAYNIVGTFETVTCTETRVLSNLGDLSVYDPIDCVPGGAENAQFAMTSHRQIATSLSPTIEAEYTTEWTRETVTSATPPDETFFGNGPGKWIRKPQILSGEFKANPDAPTPGTDFLFQSEILDYGKNLGLDNGRLLQEILPIMVADLGCGLGCVSNFFNINPQGVISNIAYDRAEERLWRVLLYERTDVTRWNADNNATKLEVVFEEFIGWMKDMFNLDWGIEIIADVPRFRLEHVSYFTANNQNDFTAGPYAKYVRGKNNYEFIAREDVPREEVFRFGDSKTPYFVPSTLVYTDCANSAASKDHNVPNVSNDLAWLSSGSQSTDGISFVATYQFAGKNYIFYDYNVLNGAMSWRELLIHYWLYERHAEAVQVNSSDYTDNFTAYSLRPVKKGAQVAIPLDDATETAFDPARRQNTGLGWGLVESAEYDTLTRVMTLNLQYE